MTRITQEHRTRYVQREVLQLTSFIELKKIFEDGFDIKIQEGSVLKYLIFCTSKYHLGFSIDQTYHIMEFVNEWFPYGNFREVDTPFWTDSTYEKELMISILCTGNSIQR